MSDVDFSLPIRTENDGDAVVKIGDGATPSQFWAIGTDGRGQVNVLDSEGDELAINTDGSINVNVVDATAGTEVHVFGTTAAGVPNTQITVVDFTVTAGKTLMLRAIQAAASGKFRYELKTGTPSSEVTRAVGFGNGISGGDRELIFPQTIDVVAGDKVLVIIENRDKANADVYAFINGNEI